MTITKYFGYLVAFVADQDDDIRDADLAHHLDLISDEGLVADREDWLRI